MQVGSGRDLRLGGGLRTCQGQCLGWGTAANLLPRRECHVGCGGGFGIGWRRWA